MGQRWVHVIINTHGSWLPGDERGFRNRGHRVHSSGDYKHRPSAEEHAGLREYHQQRSAKAVWLNQEARILVSRCIVVKMRLLGHRVIAVSAGGEHVHALCELPVDYALMKRDVGKCKQYASYGIRKMLQGTIWSAGGDYEIIHDKEHLHNAYNYIRTKQEPGTVVWSHRPDEDWIEHPNVGIPIMTKNRERARIFPPSPPDLNAGV